MADFEKYFPKLLKYEGGYVNDPADQGGETFCGISRKAFPNWAGWEAIDLYKAQPLFPATLKADKGLMSEVQVFYKSKFWDKCLADQIENQSIAELIVDWVVNSGKPGIEIPQSLVNVKPDGIAGQNTIASINKQDPKTFFDRLKAAHLAFYQRLVAEHPADNKFMRGWENRLNQQIFEP